MARRFVPNPGMERALASTQDMRIYLKRVAEAGAEEAKQRAPVDSGALRDSIKGDVEMGPQGYEAKVSAGDRKAFYWGMVEFGTSKKGARPYLRPGVQAMLSRFGGRFTSKGD
jgi:HK97 gp10 family phage protein